MTPSIVVGASCGRCSTIVWRCGGASARDITEVLQRVTIPLSYGCSKRLAIAVVRYVHLTAAAECGEHAFTVLTPGQAGWAYESLRARPFLQASNELIERRGRCQTLTQEYFDTLVRADEVFAWPENQGIACTRWRHLNSGFGLLKAKAASM